MAARTNIRLLANENFPVPAIRKLRAAGVDVVAVIEAMPSAGDLIEDEPAIREELQGIQAFLKTLDKQALVDLLSRQAVWDENLFEELRLAMRVMTDKSN